MGYLRAAAGIAAPDGFLERVPLGTPYPDVVAPVRAVVRNAAIAGPCTLVIDARGVGAPVLDLLRRAGLGVGSKG